MDRVSVLQVENSSGDGLHHDVNGLNPTELYILKRFNWYILCYTTRERERERERINMNQGSCILPYPFYDAASQTACHQTPCSLLVKEVTGAPRFPGLGIESTSGCTEARF